MAMRISPTRRRLIALAGAISLGLSTLAGAASAQAEKLRLGNEGVFPPFSMVGSDGVLKGVEPDLAREMCKRMNVECELIAMDFKALIPSILQGKFDILISQLIPTPERRERLTLSRRLFTNPSTFVVPVNSQYTFTKEGLRGKGIKLALQRGAATTKWAQERFGDAIEYSLYDNPDQEKLDLLAGRVNMLFQLKINATIELISKPEGKGWKLDDIMEILNDPDVRARLRQSGVTPSPGTPEQFGQYLFQSHESSRDFFKNSTPELDLLVELAKSHPGCLGARLTGGGWGGLGGGLGENCNGS